jgi:hypothetical protein
VLLCTAALVDGCSGFVSQLRLLGTSASSVVFACACCRCLLRPSSRACWTLRAAASRPSWSAWSQRTPACWTHLARCGSSAATCYLCAHACMHLCDHTLLAIQPVDCVERNRRRSMLTNARQALAAAAVAVPRVRLTTSCPPRTRCTSTSHGTLRRPSACAASWRCHSPRQPTPRRHPHPSAPQQQQRRQLARVPLHQRVSGLCGAVWLRVQRHL